MNATMASVAALFVPEGRALVPTELGRGPWHAGALHGGPVAALAGRAAEQVVGPGMAVVRCTLELHRPVPLAPLEVGASVVRSGRRVKLVDVVVEAAGTTVALARALALVRREDAWPEPSSTASGQLLDEDPDGPGQGGLVGSGVPGPDALSPLVPPAGAPPAFLGTGAELRFARGGLHEKGPAFVWIRLAVPVVAGEAPSPLQRALAAADFGNGVSAELRFGEDLFINPDLTVALWRPPAGEWVGIAARTYLGSSGVGAAESSLWDQQGRIGRAVQNLVVEVGGASGFRSHL